MNAPIEVTVETVQLLARLAGLTIPAEDIEPLVGALRNHLASLAALDELDLTEVDPITTFDPRWK